MAVGMNVVLLQDTLRPVRTQLSAEGRSGSR